MSDKEMRITGVVVFLTSGFTKEFENVVDVGLDKEYGFPRLSIHREHGKTETFNLNHVESYETITEYVN